MVAGVFSPDTLPLRVNVYPSAYICNTDPSHLPGKHWVVMWMENPRKAEFFDSLGHSPNHYDDRIKKFLANNSDNITHNEQILQKKKYFDMWISRTILFVDEMLSLCSD
jgi:hypothetical protein